MNKVMMLSTGAPLKKSSWNQFFWPLILNREKEKEIIYATRYCLVALGNTDSVFDLI
jgi:ABC-type glycerol-3-phosphate transport system permease component